jgi:predicted RNase H-like nuclease
MTGWIGIVLSGVAATPHAAATIEQLVAAAGLDGQIDVVAIDMPIGLPDAGTPPGRSAGPNGRIPRGAVGVHRPVRAALASPDHASAVAINRKLAGAGVSAQAFALRAKVLQVDDWVHHQDTRVVEIHPEVSFATLAGAPLTERNTSWARAVRRRRLLAGRRLSLASGMGPPLCHDLGTTWVGV